MPTRLFETLRALRAFEREHVDFLRTEQDYHLIAEIGHHLAMGKPLTLKQLSLLDVGSIATVQRRLRRLKEFGLVKNRRAVNDRRAVELTLTPKCVRIFAEYGAQTSLKLLTQRREKDRRATHRAVEQRFGSSEPSHVCGLCDSDAGSRNLVVTFLIKGLERKNKVVLVAPAGVQDDILAELHHRRKTPEQLVVSAGYSSGEAQFAFFTRVFEEAKQAGQAMCVATDMSWTLSKKVKMHVILDGEKRFDTMSRRSPLTGLCVYDARHFSSGAFLHATKCHRDHSHHPILLG